MHIPSRLNFLLLAVFFSAFSAPHIAAEQIDSGAHPDERIYVDAVVNSASGTPVGNFQQRDFTIFDNGVPQTITSFEAIDARHAQIDVIIVFDTLTLNPRALGTALTDIKRFLKADGGELTYPTTVDFVTNKGLEFKAGPSRDGNALSTSLNKPADATAIQDIKGDPGTYPPFQALAELIALERNKPGHKIILFISPGSRPSLDPYHALDPNHYGRPSELELQQLRQKMFGNIVQLTRQLNDGKITVYSIDPPLVGDLDDVFTSGASHLEPSHVGADVAAVRSPDDVRWDDLSLRAVAVRSGGLGLHSGQDLTATLRECVADISPFYELSFDPVLTDDKNQYHSVKVQFTKPGLTARTAQGYYSEPWPGAQLAKDANKLDEPNATAADPQVPALDLGDTSESRVKNLNAEATTYVNMSLDRVIARIPELKDLQPAPDQTQLPTILKKMGSNVDIFTNNVGDLIANEDLTQQRLNPDGKIKAKQRSHDDYLILHHGYEWGASAEYRMDKNGNRLESVGLEKGYLVTAGYAMNCVSFATVTQSQSDFRYLGDQKLGTRDAYVVSFSQKPVESTFKTVMRGMGGRDVEMLTQGILWIDKNNFQILRLRTDLQQPNKEIRLNQATTDVSFSQVQLQNNPDPLWLPDDVTVFIEIANEKYRNLHHYSNYRRYQVEVKIGNSP